MMQLLLSYSQRKRPRQTLEEEEKRKAKSMEKCVLPASIIQKVRSSTESKLHLQLSVRNANPHVHARKHSLCSRRYGRRPTRVTLSACNP
ncbi:Uncharacterized protein TCM_014287 [Theobroma cacao]|uniref:Uncharacterized protein n=1 Tax=Theobroma cacao TaxID=3641 RepID=A0A061FYF9_THECC|nr:Uncharacterized protein TCM_014287 [Theobroma cacao]